MGNELQAQDQQFFLFCQVGFARAFCDIHCVRDAVIRGDRSIIRNLELATKKTNSNMKALVKWSAEAARTETGWLGDKLDYMHAINTAYLQEIHTMLTEQGSDQDQEALLQNTKILTDSMLQELAGYAEASSFNELSRITATGALTEFLQAPDLPNSPNATEAASLLSRLDVMHQTLQRAGNGQDKQRMLSHQIAESLRGLQHQASSQLRTLGIYRMESNASSYLARSKSALVQERHQVMVAMDHLWWQLRTKLAAA